MYIYFGTGKNKCVYDINDITLKHGRQVCRAIPFFHAFSGCDNTSSLFNQGKCKLWDKWHDFPDNESLTRFFSELSSNPLSITTDHMAILERFVLFVYYPNISDNFDLNIQRMHDFEFSTHNNFRHLPPKSGLIEHVKRATYVAGWIFYQCLCDIALPEPERWGWTTDNGQYFPKWQDIENPVNPLVITITCTCVSAKCIKCSCSKQTMQCITFCKCKRNCLFTHI